MMDKYAKIRQLSYFIDMRVVVTVSPLVEANILTSFPELFLNLKS